MGLDMYLYRISKPQMTAEQLSAYSCEELNDMGYYIFIKDNLPANFESIRAMTEEFQTNASYVDVAAIKRKYNIPDYAYISGVAYEDAVIFYFRWDNDSSMSVSLTNDEYETFNRVESVVAYCVSVQEVAYWRKFYELQDAFHSVSEVNIENCGYYPLNEKMLDVLKHFDVDAYRLVHQHNDPTSILAYHEWY